MFHEGMQLMECYTSKCLVFSSSYLNEEQAKLAKKEEKKRKTSVFSRISNSYRTKRV